MTVPRYLIILIPLTIYYISMASATLSAPIGGATATLLVVYPHGGLTDAELKAELLVIQSWFIVFNSNGAVGPLIVRLLSCADDLFIQDIGGKLPNSTQSFPASVMLATYVPELEPLILLEQFSLIPGLDKQERPACIHNQPNRTCAHHRPH